MAADGPASESVYALLVTREQVVYAGTLRGLYQSADGGATWEETGLMEQEITALADWAGALFAGTSEEGLLLPAGSLFRSPDRGGTWEDVFIGFAVESLIGSGPVMYAGAGGLLRSLDGGRIWEQLPSSTDLPGMVHTTVVHEWKLYAGTSGGVFCSEDGGEVWEALGPVSTEVFVLAVSGEMLLAGTVRGLLVTRDRGATWFDTGVTGRSVKALLCGEDALYAGGEGGLFVSRDDGENWDRMESVNSWVNALAFYGEKLLVGSSDGLISMSEYSR